jgi:thiamine biosynthesis lipoprotein
MLTVDARAGSVTKARPDVRADLSGIAKGFGVDQAARALEALGFGDYLIEAGGEVRTRGLNAHGEPWRIGIERPEPTPPQVHCVVPLSGLSMATSGDYRLFRAGRAAVLARDRPHRRADPARARIGDFVAPECVRHDGAALIMLGPSGARAGGGGLAAYFIVRERDGGFSGGSRARSRRSAGRQCAAGAMDTPPRPW